MHNNYKYREAAIADLQQLKDLAVLSYGQYKSKLAEEHWKKMAINLGNEDTHETLLKMAKCFICGHQGKIIGMAYLIPKGNPTAFFEAGWAYIRLLGVDPSYGGQGIGKKLTEMCIDASKAAGEKTLALHTSEFQDAARHIYESIGFTKIKELETIYDKKYWLYTLTL